MRRVGAGIAPGSAASCVIAAVSGTVSAVSRRHCRRTAGRQDAARAAAAKGDRHADIRFCHQNKNPFLLNKVYGNICEILKICDFACNFTMGRL